MLCKLQSFAVLRVILGVVKKQNMFSVPRPLPFLRPPAFYASVPSGFFRLRDNSSITWWNFIKLGQKVKLDVTINWLDFEWDCVAGGGGGGGGGLMGG